MRKVQRWEGISFIKGREVKDGGILRMEVNEVELSKALWLAAALEAK